MAGAGMKLIGSWDQTQKILAAAPADLKQARTKALLQEALYLLNELRKNFKKVQPPNAKSTIRDKGSSKPLVNHRDMYNSMQIVPAKPVDEVFIGIPASAKSRGSGGGRNTKGQFTKSAKGAEIVRLVEIHEFGKTIIQQMTAKQRAYLHAKLGKQGGSAGGGGSGTGVIVIHIPPRPFIKPTFEQNPPEKIAERFLERLIANLKVIPKPK